MGYSQSTIGTFNQSAGQVTAEYLYCGDSSGGEGVYQLSGTAQLNAQTEYIGYNSSNGGNGQFIQTGGTNSVSSELYIYNGSYAMSGNSTLSAESMQMSSYSLTASTFTQNGGSVSIVSSQSYIGYGGQASYTMTNGATLTTNNESLYIANGGTGTFSQTDSTVNIGTATLYLASQSNSTASYTLAGNSQLNTGNQYLGDSSLSTHVAFTQTGGSNNLGTATLYLGGGGAATYTMSGNSTLSSGNQYIGNSGGTATFVQTGGVNTLGNYNLYVGNGSSASSYTLAGGGSLMAANEYIGSQISGIFNQTGGINVVNGSGSSSGILYVGYNNSSSGNGQYFLSGGALAVTNEFIGYNSGSGNGPNALFSESGGTNTTVNLTISSVGRFNLVAGALQVSKSFANNGIFDLQNPAQQGLPGTNAVILAGVPITGTGSLIVEPDASLSSAAIAQGSLTIGGKIQIAPNSAVSKINSLNLTGGTLDITNNAMVIDYGSSTADPLGAIRGYVHAGAASNWSGPGLISSSAAGIAGVAVGYAEASDPGVIPFSNITYDSESILVRYTWEGDANLDGKVDASDMAMISSTGSTWDTGDFNYDGQVNADDYALFDLGLAESGGNAIALPEPGVGILLTFATLLAGRRIRKH
jgi:hypothetical protein